MFRFGIPCALLWIFALTALPASSQLAATPPMGWNSWDAYRFSIDEDQFKANAAVLAKVQQYGWKYVVVDEGWYMANPDGHDLGEREYQMDGNGLLIPDAARFPSAAGGAGFKALADWVHAQGLKFGVHIVRGIPRAAVQANLPIAGSSFRAREAADTTSTCPWDDGTYGVADNAAGQAYYDSMLRLYASWGVDFLKADCIADRPYRPTEIRQIAAAIRKTGRPILLSLSPGPTALDHTTEIQQWAQMWRISDDHWDGWTFSHEPGKGDFPSGIREAFDLLAKWYPYTGPDSWPDADMLPQGWLGPHPGWGSARETRETPDERRTEFNLWSIARSPLIVGANLTKLDELTRSFLTNQKLLFMNQNATYSRPVDTAPLGPGFANARVWRATINQPGARGYAEYFGFFNLDSQPATLRATWKELGMDGRKHTAQNLWDDSTSKESKEITLTLPAHGSAIFQVR